MATAPALEKGLELLRAMHNGGEFSLEQLAARRNMPKSSTLRLLETLVNCGLVARDDRTKRFTARVRLMPLELSGEATFVRRRSDALRSLSHETQQTAEWWEDSSGGARGPVLVERESPPDREVLVRARVGYVFEMEKLEAVPVVAAAMLGVRARPWKRWQHERLVPAPAAMVKARMKQIHEAGISIDIEPNFYGVRRIAIPVRHNGQVRGILALGVAPWPIVENLDAAFGTQLRAAAREIEGDTRHG